MQLLSRLTLVFFVALLSSNTLAQNYPNRPIRAIVPIPAGSGTDVMARFVMDGISKATGKSLIVENRPGAGSNIGMAAGEKAAPDGYTVTFGGWGAYIINPLIYDLPGWDAKNFEPVVMVGRLPFVAVVNVDVPVKTFPELIAYSKSNPGKVNIALPSTSAKVIFELLKRTTEASLFPVSYATNNPAVVDTVAGRVSVMVDTVSALLPHVNSGRLRAIAITTQKTSFLLPNLKSIAEQGAPAFGEVVGWTSILVPKGTPAEAVSWLNAEVNKVLAHPDTRRRLADLGAEPGGGTSQELGAYFVAEREKWAPIVREAKIKPD